MHLEGENAVVRTFLQNTIACAVINKRTKFAHPMEKLSDSGLFQWHAQASKPFPYLLRATLANGIQHTFEDAYRFLPTISQVDAYLFNAGHAPWIHHHLGAHRRQVEGTTGISFAVWAPNARYVSVVGDFNHWDRHYFPMRQLGSSGIWELFIPELPEKGRYKYGLTDRHGNYQLRSDPFALSHEGSPNHASWYGAEEFYHWHDAMWMKKRADWKPHREPISIYEVHLGSWRRVVEENDRSLSYRESAHQLADYCLSVGFTHVELLPICEFPFEDSWGYQTTGFFAPTFRHGGPNDFKYFVDTLHGQGVGVILDWVPSHFPKDRFALAQFDGTCLFEHEDPRIGEHKGWGTLVFNYGRNEVRNFLISSAISWLERFHVDGFRVDAVSSMLYRNYCRRDGDWIVNQYGGHENFEAIDFLKEFNVLTHKHFPGIITIAEEATSFPSLTKPVHLGGIGFDFKWNMGWMHDTLGYFSRDPIHRRHNHNQITFAMLYQYSENFILALSHDEVVHGKSSLLARMPTNDIRRKVHMLRSLFGYMWTWPGKKSLFMGGEFGQYNEWCHGRSLDWHLLEHADHRGLRRWIYDLNVFYRNRSWLGYGDNEPDEFRWINPDDRDHSILSYLRTGQEIFQKVLVVCNFTPIPRNNYRVGVPLAGHWVEILNSDSAIYDGDNGGNMGEKVSEHIPSDGFDNSLNLFIPANATVIFEFQPNASDAYSACTNS
ncbi:MAG: 1,4-alpha-glucan branching protein GlgB [Puniceicoccales bacterium]|jgi:1,4-alpha-glucan branching enzyme|nr:1,4-alpha-glucan branching protein GlgB [Puniceicoccales bacterium]